MDDGALRAMRSYRLKTRIFTLGPRVLVGLLGLALTLPSLPAQNRAAKPGKHANQGSLSIPARTARGGSGAEQPPDLIIVEAPEAPSGALSARFPKGSRLARVSPPERTPRNLTSAFFAAADPRISFDGTRVLFAGRRTAASTWQIWEMHADGAGVRQVTNCRGDCLRPAYLPRGQIAYTAVAQEVTSEQLNLAQSRVAPAAASGARSRLGSQLWVGNLDGTDAHAITFGPGDFELETVLLSGRLLLTARSPLLPANKRPTDRELYTLRPDGTGLATLRCEHQHPAVRSQAAEMDDGAVVFLKSRLDGTSSDGELEWVRRGAVHEAPLAVPALHAWSAQPLAGNELLVAHTVGMSMSQQMRLALLDAGSASITATLYESTRLPAVEAVPVVAHAPPRWYWSTLNPALKRGYFVCLDSYQSAGLPHGRITTTLGRVRVFTLDAATQGESVLGEVPVEPDGSFYIAVPPDTPVRFEVLDRTEHVVRAQRSWIWSRSGEEHGCVGCHEDRALAPENRWPLALRRFDTPTRLDRQEAGGSKQ